MRGSVHRCKPTRHGLQTVRNAEVSRDLELSLQHHHRLARDAELYRLSLTFTSDAFGPAGQTNPRADRGLLLGAHLS